MLKKNLKFNCLTINKRWFDLFFSPLWVKMRMGLKERSIEHWLGYLPL